MLLSIILLNFGKPQLTLACLHSIYSLYKKQFEQGEFECLIVDNHSVDNSVKELKKDLAHKKYSNVELLEARINAGFGAGNNLASKKAQGKLLLFLNNDTKVISGIDKMVKYMQENPKIAILGGKLSNRDGSEQVSTDRFYTLDRVFWLLLGLQKLSFLRKNPREIKQVDWVKGALLLIRQEIFEKLTGFDEQIFMYMEDMELCYRAYQQGYRIYFYPFTDIIHLDQGSSDRNFAIVNIYQSLLYFYAKHRTKFEYSLVKFLLVSKAKLLIAWGQLSHQPQFVIRYQQALKF